MTNDSPLTELIERWQLLQAQGQSITPEELCADCPELLEPLRRHLREVGWMEDFLDPPTADAPRPELASTLPGFSHVSGAPSPVPAPPGYEILGELGHGGMGIVYKAYHFQLKRIVALKMIRSGVHAGLEELVRFRVEAEAVAKFQHAHIVQIHEIGEHQGLPYFSLEYVEGGSLAKQLAVAPLSPRQAAELIEVLARTMQAAHQRNIIHRDLKPGNVLLTAEGTPKIADFGLAKQLDAEAGHTQTGFPMGTPSYMPPEQARGDKAIGLAVDIYALGAILYECLTSRPPFRAATPMETIRQVENEEPVPPRRLQPEVPRDLETICLKCLQKEPRRRYASAVELAEDLRRYQAGVPITARPVGTGERLLKWARRRPAAAALLAVSVAAALALLGVIAVYSAIVQRSNLDLARSYRELEEANRNIADERNKALQAEKVALDETGKARAAEKVASDRLEHVRNNLFTAQLMRVKAVYERDPAEGIWLLHDYNACPIDLRDFAWGWYAHQCQRNRFLTLTGHAGSVTSVAFSSDGKTLASGGEDQTVRLWDVATGQERAVLKGHAGSVTSVAFSSDGKTLASGGQEGRGEVHLWDVATGQERAVLKGHTSEVTSVAFSGDGKILASGGWDETVRLWDVATGQQRAILKGHAGSFTSVAFSSDGKTLASGGRNQTVVRLWDVATGQQRAVLQGHNDGGVTAVAFSGDGKTLASASSGNPAVGALLCEVRLWDVATGQERAVLKGHAGSVTSVAFSGDGKTLASGGKDQTVRLWHVATGQERAVLKGHADSVTSVAFSSDGKTLASGGQEGRGEVHLWDVATGQERAVLRGGYAGSVTSVAFSGDGKTLAAGSRSAGALSPGEVRLWDVATGQERAVLKGHTSEVTSVAFSGDGKILASGGWDETVRLWDVATGQERAVLRGHTSVVTSVAFSGDGKTLASGGCDNTVRLWDVAVGQQRAVLKGHTSKIAKVASVAFSSDGKTLASGGQNAEGRGEVRLWDVATGQQRAVLKGHTSEVSSVAFSGDGKTLASGGWDETVRLWDVATGQQRTVLKGHTNIVTSVAFSSDGKTLASGSGNPFALDVLPSEMRLWEVATGQERAVLRADFGVTSVAFSGDGKTLASGDYDNTVRLWDVEAVLQAAFQPAKPAK